MAARILEALDALVAKITAEVPPGQAIVEDVFASADKLTTEQDEAPSPLFRVYVYPASYFEFARVARKRVENQYDFSILITKLYTEPAQPLPTARISKTWVRECIEWANQYVYIPINAAGVHLDETDPILDELRPVTCNVTVVFDPERLDQQKRFWSLIDVSYQETERG